jgi:hypothetical protein
MNTAHNVNPHAVILCPHCTVVTAIVRSTGTAKGYTEMVVIFHQPHCVGTLEHRAEPDDTTVRWNTREAA